MKHIMIKILVVALGVSAYFNVSGYLENIRYEDEIKLLEDTITQLEELNNSLTNVDPDDGSCKKLHEIYVTVVNEKEDVDITVTHCTNASLLGDVLDELQEDLQIVYDPNYSRDYIYGRLVHSFYGMGKEFEEYYAITVDGVYAETGLDFIVIETGSEYAFTLTRWG